MISPESTLEEVFDHLWGMLVRGGADAKHAYHFPVLATYGSSGIQQRTLVLRKSLKAQRQLYCYSDQRTQKVDDIIRNKEAHWLFYDHGSKEQIRAKVQMSYHHQDEVAREVWKNISPKNRGDYLGPVPPGTIVERYTDNRPASFKNDPTEQNTQAGFNNFALMISTVYDLDFLKLRREGHLRAQFHWNTDHWESSWVAP